MSLAPSSNLCKQKLRAHAHLGYGFGADRWQVLYERDLVPDKVPYGFHHAANFGAAVTYSIDHLESSMVRVLRKGLQKLLGFDMIHAFRNRKAINAADITWTMEEKQYLAVLLWMVLLPSMRNRKVIGQTIWLYDRWDSTHAIRRTVLSRLVRRAAALTVHSSNYVGLPRLAARSIYPRLLPFGISQDSFPLTIEVHERHTPIRILSMGTDCTRDWDTFLAAFGNDDRFDVIVISGVMSQAKLSGYGNVSTRLQPTMDTFRTCYRWADFVVIPMSPNLYSGITVALEATSMGVPVLSSATGGVPTYFDETQVLYVEPLDPEAMRNSLLHCMDTQRKELVRCAQRKFAEQDYSSRGMARRYVDLSLEILSARTEATK